MSAFICSNEHISEIACAAWNDRDDSIRGIGRKGGMDERVLLGT